MNLFLSRLGLDSYLAPCDEPSRNPLAADYRARDPYAQGFVVAQQQNRFVQELGAQLAALANTYRTPAQQKLDRAKAIAAEVRERKGWKVQRAVHD